MLVGACLQNINESVKANDHICSVCKFVNRLSWQERETRSLLYFFLGLYFHAVSGPLFYFGSQQRQ